MSKKQKTVECGGWTVRRCRPPSREAADRRGKVWYAFKKGNVSGAAGRVALGKYIGEEPAEEAILALRNELPDMDEYLFDVSGGYSVHTSLIPVLDQVGNIVGFSNEKGETIRLVVALEVEAADGSDHRYVTKETEMEELGLTCLDYEKCDFALDVKP